MRVPRVILPSVLVVASTTAAAQAQWVATAYFHVNFGDVEFRRGGIGVSIGYVGRRLGFELDLDRHQHFFKDSKLESVPNPCKPGVVGPCIDSDTDAWIFMGNLVVPLRTAEAAKWRPYATAGLGVVHAWIHDAGQYNTSQTNLALNAGGGITYSLSTRVRLRSDLRYFRGLVDESKRDGAYYKDYGFWRVTAGAAFGFPR